MRKSTVFYYFVISIILASCAVNPKLPAATENIVMVTSPASFSKPLISGWVLGNTPLISMGDSILAILGIQLSGKETKVFYSLTGSDLSQFIKDNTIAIVDNDGTVYELVQVVPIGNIEKHKLGIMIFKPRSTGVAELYLTIASTKEQIYTQKILVANFDGPVSDDRLDLTYSVRRENGVELSGDRVEMYLWLPPAENSRDTLSTQTITNSSSSITPTPVQASGKPWVETKNGDVVQNEFSFEVENYTTKKTNYLSIQLMSGGDIITSQNGSVEVPEPIIVEIIKTSPTPYP